MDRAWLLGIKGFAILLVTAVVFLAPGVGLMTLPVLDGEPDAATILLADNSHAGKRAADDAVQSFDAARSSAAPHAIPVFTQAARICTSVSVPSWGVLQFQIRAPPSLT
jgi:hypothetical protein